MATGKCCLWMAILILETIIHRSDITKLAHLKQKKIFQLVIVDFLKALMNDLFKKKKKDKLRTKAVTVLKFPVYFRFHDRNYPLIILSYIFNKALLFC